MALPAYSLLALLRRLDRIDRTRRARFGHGLGVSFAVVGIGFLLRPLYGIDRMIECGKDREIMITLGTLDPVSLNSCHA